MTSASQPTTSSRASIPPYFQTMSPAPPSPTASRLPEPLSEPLNDSPHTVEDASVSGLPRPLLRLELRDLRHAEITTFLSNVDSSSDFANQVDNVTRLLYYSTSSPTSNRDTSTPTSTAPTTTTAPRSRPAPRKVHIPSTRSVTLILRSMDGVAYTTGIDLDDDHKEIHLSLSYIAHVSSSNKGDKIKIRHELLGVICHELVHCYQWNGLGSAPGGLIEGIADWVRLHAGYVPLHWERKAGKDISWDSGYQTTGYFLDFIEKAYGDGSVRRINEALREQEYEEDKFWTKLFGSTVDQLWKSYSTELGEDETSAEE